MLFGSKKVDCPRCLGKGHVDQKDISRLNKSLQWLSGPCAYCQGRGRASARMAQIVPADLTYLSVEHPDYERERLINGDPEALERAEYFEFQSQLVIEEIKYLHEHGLSKEQIVGFFQLRSLTFGD